ncbi:MAG: ABC transporter permease [Succinivibrionaceae bacterium]|nr:ABC transporter permease [Succinivibrionaceae bacterium]
MLISEKTLKFEQNLWGSFKCMITVIYALFLRETFTLYGESRFGYVWVLLRDMLSVSFIIVIRYYLRRMYGWEGMDIVFYYLLGFVLFYIFTESVSKCIAARKANKTILAFPHVTVIDVMISRCLLVFITNIQAGLALSLILYAVGFRLHIYDFSLFFYCLAATPLMAFTVGLFLSAVSDFYPVVEKIWNVFKMFLMLASGVIIPIERFPLPSGAMDMLALNPLFQTIEGMRQSVSLRLYIFSHVDMLYLNVIILTTLILGLLIEQKSKFEDE